MKGGDTAWDSGSSSGPTAGTPASRQVRPPTPLVRRCWGRILGVPPPTMNGEPVSLWIPGHTRPRGYTCISAPQGCACACLHPSGDARARLRSAGVCVRMRQLPRPPPRGCVRVSALQGYVRLHPFRGARTSRSAGVCVRMRLRGAWWGWCAHVSAPRGVARFRAPASPWAVMVPSGPGCAGLRLGHGCSRPLSMGGALHIVGIALVK